jgi:hypothetical protein
MLVTINKLSKKKEFDILCRIRNSSELNVSNVDLC